MNKAIVDCYLEAMHAEEAHSDGGTDAAASNEDPYVGGEDCHAEMEDHNNDVADVNVKEV